MSTRTAVATACVLLALGAAFLARPHAQDPAAAEARWRHLEGTWSASGRRESLPTESDRRAVIVQLSGALVLAIGDGLGRGFRAEFIGFDDGGTLSVGRSVWTDERGDQIFGYLKGEPVQTGRRFTGTITGGTGRYAGITGDYAFTWQYVLEADGTVQGRTSELKGRYTRARRQP